MQGTLQEAFLVVVVLLLKSDLFSIDYIVTPVVRTEDDWQSLETPLPVKKPRRNIVGIPNTQ